jgi:DNA polymerase
MPQIIQKGICFHAKGDCSIVTLPNKRELFYIKPRLTQEGYREQITYEGLNQTTKKWERIPTYGGKLTENIIQAIARDCLAESIIKLEKVGYRPLMHVHDEVICEVPKDDILLTLETAIALMCQIPKWADGLPLNAAGFKCNYYMKD